MANQYYYNLPKDYTFPINKYIYAGDAFNTVLSGLEYIKVIKLKGPAEKDGRKISYVFNFSKLYKTM